MVLALSPSAEHAVDLATAYAKERTAFGQNLLSFQNTRFVLAECRTEALAAPTRVPSAFTVVVPVLHALGGSLHPGDRVSVLATFQAAAGGAQTRAIARDLQVLAVGQTPRGFDQASATIPVTLALPDPSLASALALAEEAGKIDLLRQGAGAGAPIPPVSVGG